MYGETRCLICQNGWKHLRRILWIKVFQFTGTLPASSSRESASEPRVTVESGSGKHSIYTHFPKDKDCEICKRTKITSALCRRRTGEALPRAENSGDLTTADHKVPNEGGESRNNHCYAVSWYRI